MGKPAYGPETAEPAAQVAAEPAAGKTTPIVRIGRVECRANGSRLDVYADIHNESAEVIFLDKILLLGTTRELDSQLRPGEARQFRLYSGTLLQGQPGGYAEVRYRKQGDGDYFADYHEIRTRQQGQQGYYITEFLMRGPVKDI
jgi:hypothetical protein